MALTDTLKKYEPFQRLTIMQQEVYLTLAEYYEESSDLALYLTPKELVTKLQVGSVEQWQTFLNMEPVKIFIKSEISSQLQVNQRKAVKALSKEAELGNVSAAKQISELSGILQQADQNRIVVLHRISRPKIIKSGLNDEK